MFNKNQCSKKRADEKRNELVKKTKDLINKDRLQTKLREALAEKK